jgi:KUP system potassium uptake protein
MSEHKQVNSARPVPSAGLLALSLAALGVVFCDIGTSSLYTLKTVFSFTGENPDSIVILGVLSLVIWTLIVITTIKYVSLAMRVDNDGEGGILALMALLGVKRERRPIVLTQSSSSAARLQFNDGKIR